MIMNPRGIESFSYMSSQAKEQRISSYQGLMTCRYGYGRAISKTSEGELGQDFLQVHIMDDICNFTLCKGIGNNDDKSLASRLLGQTLMEWLETTQDWSSECFQALLKNASQSSQDAGQLSGLDAMYICGQIELPTVERPIGRIWLAWQGDSRLKLWKEDFEVSQYFNETLSQTQWWSSEHGPIGGAPYVYQSRLESGIPMRLQVYTEGISDLDPIQDWLPDEQIQLLFDAPHTYGLREDASFLEFKWS
ncbi:hypothetical protein [Paenibacillus sp. CMAA1364]